MKDENIIESLTCKDVLVMKERNRARRVMAFTAGYKMCDRETIVKLTCRPFENDYRFILEVYDNIGGCPIQMWFEDMKEAVYFYNTMIRRQDMRKGVPE